ncbi:universal stress protein [Massilia horti]|uniref:Universal stress protein n=1 Tax=Massilia horti TaxID=2562153 RepID=A0A4Y9T3K7_9BURK|nr:universal stress protein [Massilia horti]TFW33864.1 universal stress protein [Massilia horti]
MSYKTILVHADRSEHAPGRIRFAAALANSEDAHLIGAAVTGVSRFLYQEAGLDIEQSVVTGYLQRMDEVARQGAEQFVTLVRAAGVRSFEPRTVADDAEGALVRLSRFADLIVLSQTDPKQPDTDGTRGLPEYVVLGTARPVLLVPHAGEHGRLDGKALVAWDGSLAATRALAQALPLLRRASAVLVVQFNPGIQVDLALQGADMLAWLGRHGINATVEALPRAIDTGNALLSLAADRQASLLVMGAYGHTRFRELIVGGVTKTVLENMTVPVLMAH